MPGAVRGITIEFTGNTSSLSNSLKEIQRESAATNKELRAVDKALKFNPSNVTLLSQKQGLLTQKVQMTTEKLNTLKEKQKQMDAAGVDKNSEAYQKLQREIIETESQLKNFKGKLAALGNVNLTALGTKFKEIGGKMTALGKTWTTKVTGPIAAMGGVASKVAIDFDTQMSKVKALSGATGKDFDTLRNKAREMGSKTSFSAKEAGEGFEYMALAGWDSKEMVDGIKPVLDLAAASAMDLGKASDIVTDGLTAFGLEAKDAGHFADVLAKAQSKSNTTTEMLGEAFKYVAPVAGSMGYSVEDVAIALGTMANNGIKASQGGTTLRNIIQRMADPTDKVAAAMEDLGISITDSQGKTKPLIQLMGDLRKTFGENIRDSSELDGELANLNKQYETGAITEKEYEQKADKLAQTVWGAKDATKAQYASTIAGTRGMAGLLSIVNTSDEEWEKLTEEIYNCDGTTGEMADTMLDNAGGALTILKSALQELGIAFGDLLTPAIRKAAEFATALTNGIAKMSPTMKKVVLVIAGIASAIGPILFVGGKIMTLIGSAMMLISKIIGYIKLFGGVAAIAGKALAVLTGPIGIAVAAVAAFIAVMVHLYKTNKGVRKSVDGLFKAIKKAFGDVIKSVGPALKDAFEAVKSAIVEVGKALAPVVKIFLAMFAEKVKLIIRVLKIVLPWVIKLAGALLKSFANAIRVVAEIIKALAKAFQAAWKFIAKVTTDLWKKIPKMVTDACISLGKTAIKILTGFRTGVANIWNTIKKTAANIWNGIKSVIVNSVNGVKKTLSNVFTAIKTSLLTIWGGLKAAASKIWNGVKTAIMTPVNAAKKVVTNVFNAIKKTASKGWDAVKNAVSKAWTGIKNAIKTPLDAAKGIVSKAAGAIKKAMGGFGKIASGIKTAFSKVKDAITKPIDAAKKVIDGFKKTIGKIFPIKLGKIFNLKLPKISVSGGKAPWGIGGKGKLPSFSIKWPKWNAQGGIFRKPTLLANGTQGVGEAGAEAVLPLDTLWDHMDKMADSIVNGVMMANRLQASSGQMGDIHLDVYLYENGPKMNEIIYKANKAGEKVFG